MLWLQTETKRAMACGLLHCSIAGWQCSKAHMPWLLQDVIAAGCPTQDGRIQSELVPGKPCLVLLLEVLLIIRLCKHCSPAYDEFVLLHENQQGHQFELGFRMQEVVCPANFACQA